MAGPHPRDTYITLYGRKPVLEALLDPGVRVRRLLVAHGARGEVVDRIVAAAKERSVEVQRVELRQVNRISRNARQDQGVAADVPNPNMCALADYLATVPRRAKLLALDNVTTPANVGMILRSAVAFGMDGVVLPRRGCPEISPLVIKASAGVALRAPILRCADLGGGLALLRDAGFDVVGLEAGGRPLAEADRPERGVYVLGSEAGGLSEDVAGVVGERVGIPLAGEVESLNVAAAAAVVCHVLMAG